MQQGQQLLIDLSEVSTECSNIISKKRTRFKNEIALPFVRSSSNSSNKKIAKLNSTKKYKLEVSVWHICVLE